MRFRIRHPGGTSTLKTNDENVEALLKEIERISSIQPEFQCLKVGFPPKEIDLSTDATVSSLIPNGETIVVERAKAPRTMKCAAPSSCPIASQPKPQTNNPSSSASPLESSPMTVHKVPDDNSCLFRTIGYLCEGDDSDAKVTELRQLIGALVMSDNEKWNAAILGSEPEKYAEYIMKPNTWGGSVELRILSEYYQITIVAIEVKNQNFYSFGEDGGYSEQVFTMYDGIHYDALVCGKVRRFSSNDPLALMYGIQVAQSAQQRGGFTDVYTFQLKCLDCGAILKGQAAAQAHAEATRHSNFTQVS